MMRAINPDWIKEMKEKINNRDIEPVDTTQSYNPAIQWLITCLSNRNIPFKLYNLGAGVKRVTTNTDTCPCCKKKL